MVIIKNQRVRAVGIVTGMLTVSVTAILAIKLVFPYISPDVLPKIALGAFAGVMVYILYSIALAQVQYEDRVKELGKKYQIDQK